MRLRRFMIVPYPWVGFLLGLLFVLTPRVANAQTQKEGKHGLLGPPELNLEPAFSFDLLRPPLVEDVASGQIRRLPSESALKLVLSMDVPTEIPRVDLTLKTIFARSAIDNEPEFEAELNLALLREEDTAVGWKPTSIPLTR